MGSDPVMDSNPGWRNWGQTVVVRLAGAGACRGEKSEAGLVRRAPAGCRWIRTSLKRVKGERGAESRQGRDGDCLIDFSTGLGQKQRVYRVRVYQAKP